jgi:hypothetical protein
LYSNSLVLVMSAIFVVSWLIQSVGEPHASTGVEG